MVSKGQSILPSSSSTDSFHACGARHRLSSIRLSGIGEVALRQCISDGTAGAANAFFSEGEPFSVIAPLEPQSGDDTTRGDQTKKNTTTTPLKKRADTHMSSP